ncbi:MAG: ATP-binding protein [Terriglobales bacterium]
MIVSFSVSNFRSFSAEETFSLVASNRLAQSHSEHALPVPDSSEKVLRTAVLYGANGAGKSNLFKALRFLRNAVLKPRKRDGGTGRRAFRFGTSETEPSTFDLQFIANNRLYRFWLSMNDERVTEEWLAQVDGSKERMLYERTTDLNGKVKIDVEGRSRGEKLRALATVGGPQNQSFLATIRATLNVADLDDDLNEIVNWFNHGLKLVGPDASFRGLGDLLARDPEFHKFAGEFLKSSSTGVDRLNVLKKEVTEEELRSILPDGVWGRVLKSINEDEDGVAVVKIGEGNELLIEREGENRFFRFTIQSIHEHERGKNIPLELAEESDGTKRLLNLIPALHHLRIGSAAYFIDEIDRSLHPILVRQFLEFFLKSCEGGQRQIIVTTHESNLLDLELLRRDEIWFAEKDQSGATHLYSLSDFKVRKDLEIRKHYLQGRFGAVPFLGNLQQLLENQECPE